MIGIYKITNLINRKFYIGQSRDIERRFINHRTAASKSPLHKDIRKYGKKNFKYEILEECSIEELNKKEEAYIKELKPCYNCKIANEKLLREKISQGTKKWWNNLDEETKNKIITKNLVGPKVGHEVSKETREKIRNWNLNNSGTKVMIVETGEVFEKIKYLEEHLGACTGTCAAYWKGKIKTVKGYHVVKV